MLISAVNTSISLNLPVIGNRSSRKLFEDVPELDLSFVYT